MKEDSEFDKMFDDLEVKEKKARK